MAKRTKRTEPSEAPASRDPRGPHALLEDGATGVSEACAFMGISRAEVYRAMARDELKNFKFGRRRLIPRRAQVEFLAAHAER